MGNLGDKLREKVEKTKSKFRQLRPSGRSSEASATSAPGSTCTFTVPRQEDTDSSRWAPPGSPAAESIAEAGLQPSNTAAAPRTVFPEPDKTENPKASYFVSLFM
jgi:hypothetical protein